MNTTLKWVVRIAALAALLVAITLVFQKQIATRVLEQVANRNVGRNIIPSLPDGLHLALCGTGSPFPDPTRAGPCSAIMVGDRLFIVDAGEGSARNLAFMGIPAAKIEAIFLTHFHSDHLDGLGPLLLQRWGTATSTTPTPVHGPTGVVQVVDGFHGAYALDADYRVAHHSPKIMPPTGYGGKGYPFALPAIGQGNQVVVLEDRGLKVTAFRVNHGPVEPAVGYRFDYKGRSIVISGDTTPTPTLVAAATHADLLVHEALQPELLKLVQRAFEERKLAAMAQIMRDIVNYHSTPEEAAMQATRAQVKQLVLNHIVPPLPLRFAYSAFLGDSARLFSGPITVGEDGMLFSLPAGSDRITKDQLL